MSGSSGRDAFWLQYQVCPIFLTGGIAANMLGGNLPISQLLESGGVPQPGNAFANWVPLPGTELIKQEVAHYTLANQAVAGNAIIVQPRIIAYEMVCPVTNTLPWSYKQAVINALKATLAQHNIMGGLYICVTPSFFESACLLRDVKDSAQGDDNQAQNTWVWEFEVPLITLAQAQQVYSNSMNQWSGGQMVQGQPSWSGVTPSGVNPNYTGFPGTPSTPAPPAVQPPASGGVY